MKRCISWVDHTMENGDSAVKAPQIGAIAKYQCAEGKICVRPVCIKKTTVSVFACTLR